MLIQANDEWLKLDRLDLKRDNPDWIEERLSDPNSRFIVMSRYRFPMAKSHVVLMSQDEVEVLSAEPLQYYFLGQELTSKQYLFAVEIIEPNQPLDDWQSMRHHSHNEPLTEILLYAQGLLNWHRECRYCEKCGDSLTSAVSGNKRLCKNESCQSEVFPRINPAIIVLLLNDDRCLLANSKRFPGDIPMYSCIAGFSETGETFQQTLRREVYEEVGLEVVSEEYLGNQPWPFPASLMIGYHAQTANTEVAFHDGEIAAARWFTRQELKQAYLDKSIQLPSQKSISFTLIAHWYNQDGQTSLEDVVQV